MLINIIQSQFYHNMLISQTKNVEYLIYDPACLSLVFVNTSPLYNFIRSKFLIIYVVFMIKLVVVRTYANFIL